MSSPSTVAPYAASTATMVIVLFSIPIAYSLYRGFKARPEIKSAGDFLLHREGFGAPKLRDSITASNVSLGAAIFAFLSFGYSFRVGAIISPITWLLGFWLLLRIYPRLPEVRERRTLHGFLTARFQSRTLGYIASVASIIGFLGAYGVEVLVAIKLFAAVFQAGPWNVPIAFALATVVTAYTALGGFKAASHADTVRLYGTIMGILVAVGFAGSTVVSGNAEMRKIGFHEFTADWLGFSTITPLFFFSLLVLNVPWQLVDMSVWQRLSACTDRKQAEKGVVQSVPAIAVLWILLIGLGAALHFFPGFVPPPDGDFATPFLGYIQKHPILLGLFGAGCLAGLMSTADSLLIASVQTLVMDVFYPDKQPEDVLNADSLSSSTRSSALLPLCRKWVWIFGLLAPLFVYFCNMLVPGILDLFFLIYTAQLVLLPSVAAALIIKRSSPRLATIATASLLLGLVAAFTMFCVMITHPNMNVFLATPLVALATATVPWVLARSAPKG